MVARHLSWPCCGPVMLACSSARDPRGTECLALPAGSSAESRGHQGWKTVYASGRQSRDVASAGYALTRGLAIGWVASPPGACPTMQTRPAVGLARRRKSTIRRLQKMSVQKPVLTPPNGGRERLRVYGRIECRDARWESSSKTQLNRDAVLLLVSAASCCCSPPSLECSIRLPEGTVSAAIGRRETGFWTDICSLLIVDFRRRACPTASERQVSNPGALEIPPSYRLATEGILSREDLLPSCRLALRARNRARTGVEQPLTPIPPLCHCLNSAGSGRSNRPGASAGSHRARQRAMAYHASAVFTSGSSPVSPSGTRATYLTTSRWVRHR